MFGVRVRFLRRDGGGSGVWVMVCKAQCSACGFRIRNARWRKDECCVETDLMVPLFLPLTLVLALAISSSLSPSLPLLISLACMQHNNAF